MNPKITIGTLCYNNSEEVLRTLPIIKNQTYNNIEHIIVDDCSHDESAQIIKRWIEANNHQCTFIVNDENIGICKSLNKILSLATGDYWTAISDDYWEPFHIEKSLELLTQSGADVIYSSTRMCKPNGELLYLLEDTLPRIGYPRYQELFGFNDPFFLLDNEKAIDALFYCNYLHLISFLLPMHYIRSLGGYNENLPFEDYDLNFNICSTSKVCFNKSFSTTYYKHERSYTQSPLRSLPMLWGIILTLMNHKHLVKQADTKEVIRRKITDSCFEIIKIKPSEFWKVVATYNKAFPEYGYSKSLYTFSKQLFRNKVAHERNKMLKAFEQN